MGPFILLAVLLMFAFNNCDTGIYLRFWTSGNVFDLRRFDANSKNCEMLFRELLYTDDAVFIVHSVKYMQIIIDRFFFACTAFWFTINLKKTKAAPKPNIFINDTRLDVVSIIKYLGSTLSWDGSVNAELHLRIQKASFALGKLEKRVWSDHTIYPCVLTTPLYSSGMNNVSSASRTS